MLSEEEAALTHLLVTEDPVWLLLHGGVVSRHPTAGLKNSLIIGDKILKRGLFIIFFKFASCQYNRLAISSRWSRTAASSPPCLRITIATSTVMKSSKAVVFAPLWPRAVDRSSW